MQHNLLRFNKNQKYIVFDTETEGLSLATSRPWQLSWMIFENNNIRHENHYIDWPDLNISAGAAKITRFDYSFWKKRSEDPLTILNIFNKYLYDENYLIVGANLLGFDIYIINTLRKILGFNSDYSYISRILDIQCIQKGIYAGLKSIPDDRLTWQYQMYHTVKKGVKTSVKHLCSIYDIPFDENMAHDAVYDNEKCFEIFKKQILTIDI
jgi:DNA polymerase III epsilon subunit-like protein